MYDYGVSENGLHPNLWSCNGENSLPVDGMSYSPILDKPAWKPTMKTGVDPNIRAISSWFDKLSHPMIQKWDLDQRSRIGKDLVPTPVWDVDKDGFPFEVWIDADRRSSSCSSPETGTLCRSNYRDRLLSRPPRDTGLRPRLGTAGLWRANTKTSLQLGQLQEETFVQTRPQTEDPLEQEGRPDRKEPITGGSPDIFNLI